jgi:hypothetical protein
MSYAAGPGAGAKATGGPSAECVMSIEPVAAPDAEHEAASPRASSEERIDFLKQSIQFTESTIRAYDTKSQIALGAFVLSMSPLWSILSATCASAASRPIVIVLVGAFICTIMLYCFVLWPVRALDELVKNVRTKGLFFLHDPVAAGSSFPMQIKDVSVESELTAEALKLSFIRASKGRRFKYALWATTVFYAFVFVSFLILRQCT